MTGHIKKLQNFVLLFGFLKKTKNQYTGEEPSMSRGLRIFFQKLIDRGGDGTINDLFRLF